jgi:hypothetical protein
LWRSLHIVVESWQIGPSVNVFAPCNAARHEQHAQQPHRHGMGGTEAMAKKGHGSQGQEQAGCGSTNEQAGKSASDERDAELWVRASR